MRAMIYFTKKEFLESWRTSKLWILAIVFLIFGVMNPLMAKFLPEIIKSTMGEAIAGAIPAPTSIDSWTQFYKNISQMGLVVMVLLANGTISQEVSRGTLVNLVTKGLNRTSVVLSKAIFLMVQWTFCISIAFFVTWGYTLYYFPDNKSPHVWFAVFPMWLFGILLVGVILAASAASRNSYEGLLMVGGFVVILFILQIFDKAKEYNPLSLITENMTVLQKSSELEFYLPAMIISTVLFLSFVGCGILILNRKKL
ncbi:ABC transporter permease [Enterococcus sp. AZ072]|uniref:ABC transporter permease n=1 Tax=unclassified Enterococcus TaxID=2608891 RepID=UPI003D292062